MSQTKAQLIDAVDGSIVTADIADQAITLDKLLHGTGSTDGKFLRANNGADPTFESVITDLVNDTSPQLGGDLASNGNDIDFADGDKAIFGTGEDLEIYHSNNESFIDDKGSGNLFIRSNGAGIHLKKHGTTETLATFNTDGNCELYYDNVKKFETRATDCRVYDDLKLEDNLKVKLGTADDLQIVHDGTDSIINNQTGNLFFRSGSTHLQSLTGENKIVAEADGAVELYYDNSKKFGTSTNGVKITNSPSGATSGALKINTDFANYGHIIVRDKNQYQTSALTVENENDGLNETCYIYRAVDLGSSTWANARMTALSHRFQISTDIAGSNEKFVIDVNGIKATGATTGIVRVNTNLINYGGVTVRDQSNSDQSNHIACFQAENGSTGSDTTNIVTRSVDLNSSSWANAKYAGKTHKFTCNGSTDASIKVRIDSDGLKFNTDSAAANALDDYEEGTYTPFVYVGGGTSGVTQPSTKNGSYTKIGKRVFFNLHISGTLSYTGSHYHGIQIGLPFATNSSAAYYSALTVWFYAGVTNEQNVIARTEVNDSKFIIQYPGDSIAFLRVDSDWNMMVSGQFDTN